MHSIKLSIGPIQYFWPRQQVLNFYERAANSSAEIIYLGETVCAKRREVKLDDWLAIGANLAQSGKEVILSSLTLLEAASESSSLKRLCLNGTFVVEANDIAAIQLLTEAGKPFVAGPGINIYNDRSLRLLARKGLRRWVLPVELGLQTLKAMQAKRPEGVETEVFALGRLPLSYSARCYTARSHNLPKDDCRFVCMDYPDGRLLKTREDRDFLVLNGIQTQSALTHQTLDQVPDLEAAGVDVLRISPQSGGTMRIVEIFHMARNGADLQLLGAELSGLLPGGACNGYLLHQPGMNHGVAGTA